MNFDEKKVKQQELDAKIEYKRAEISDIISALNNAEDHVGKLQAGLQQSQRELEVLESRRQYIDA